MDNNSDKLNYILADCNHFERHHPYLSKVIAGASLKMLNDIAKTHKESLGFPDALSAQERVLDLQFGYWLRAARGNQ